MDAAPVSACRPIELTYKLAQGARHKHPIKDSHMTTLTAIPVNTITGQPTSLADYAGKVLLVVNVASKCGLTPQYEGLEKLQEDLGPKGVFRAWLSRQ